MKKFLRNLIVVFGDQLDHQSSVWDGFDPTQDAVWMCESRGESDKSWSSKQRTAFFLSAMRHFAQELQEQNKTVVYKHIDQDHPNDIVEALGVDIKSLAPQKIIFVAPGDFVLREDIFKLLASNNQAFEERLDRHFLITPEDFKVWASGKKEVRMEWFYRWMRQKFNILMDQGKPVGGAWNFDADNRKPWGKSGPGKIDRLVFEPDDTTKNVCADVERHFPNAPGSLSSWDWPVNRQEALLALDDFIKNHLPLFGPRQDAMWQGEPYLHHAKLSACLNTKMISPQEVLAAAVLAFDQKQVEISSVEGFVRQILGWREFVRGVYWLKMPDFFEQNALNHHQNLPDFYWTGDTDMVCLRESVKETLQNGYAHHIQRLMVLGLFAQLLGVEPKQIHKWFLSVYTDAVEWVEIPNVLGMSQYSDGGFMVSKPYVASGAYINRMSNYCASCPYAPERATGDQSCPFTTLYWNFLIHHEKPFATHPRTSLQWKSLRHKTPQEQTEIQSLAQALQLRFGGTTNSNS